ncbi:MAG: type IV conjugative transfer system coupling protein TraD, partial [Shewanella sp.]
PPFIKRSYEPSEKMKQLEWNLNYHQFSAVQFIDKADKSKLQSIHDTMYEGDDNEEERKMEVMRMTALAEKTDAVAQQLIDAKKSKPSQQSRSEADEKKALKEKEAADQHIEAARRTEEMQIMKHEPAELELD